METPSRLPFRRGEQLSLQSASNRDQDAFFKSSSSLLVAEPKNNKSAGRPRACGRVGDPSVGSAGKESDTLLGNYAMKVLSSGRSVGGQI